MREFDRAFADLARGAAIDSTIYGISYHLGVVQSGGWPAFGFIVSEVELRRLG